MSDRDPSDLRTRARDLFYEALDQEPESRVAFVEQACGNDSTLHDEVLSLLDAYDDATSFLEASPVKVSESHESFLGMRLGEYVIKDILAVGGMGVVFTGTQQTPRRDVAIKLVKPELMNRRVLRRFELEAELLGQLNHPNIAQIYESGTAPTDKGPRPFLAMELVDGVALTEYCKDRPLEQQVEIFVAVCDALHYAHLRGIIHRDLKPSNILVTPHGQPKLLDFGVARVTNDEHAPLTIATQANQLIGTIPYMSPEQVRSDEQGLDTRLDVYALGVVFYEALTGSLPYELRGKPIPEATRVICEEDPVPLGRKRAEWKGDLATILAKALAKQRSDRYQSAAELGEDLRRFLAHEPVGAQSPTPMYQLKKFVQRHRGLVAGMALAFALLVIGVTVSTVLLFQTIQARNDAKEALARSERETKLKTAINQVLEEMLVAPDPWQNNPLVPVARETRVVDVLNSTARRLDENPDQEAEVERSVRFLLGRTYAKLGFLEEAEPQTRRALELSKSLFGSRHSHTIDANEDLAGLHFDQDRIDEAITLQTECVRLRREMDGEEAPSTLSARNDLALFLQGQGKFDQAEQILRDVLDIQRRRPEPSPTGLALALHNWSALLFEQRRLEAAIPPLEEALELRKEALGETHPRTLATTTALAVLYQEQRNHEKATPLLVEATQGTQSAFGADSPHTHRVKMQLALAHTVAGRLLDTETLVNEILASPADRPGADLRIRGRAFLMRGRVAFMQGNVQKSEEDFRDALSLFRQELEEGDQDLVNAEGSLGSTLIRTGKYQEAEELLANASKYAVQAFGEHHQDPLQIYYQYAGALISQSEWEAALEPLETALDFAEEWELDHPIVGELRQQYGSALWSLDDFEEAEFQFLEAMEILRTHFGPRHQLFQACAESLVEIYEATGRSEDADYLRSELR